MATDSSTPGLVFTGPDRTRPYVMRQQVARISRTVLMRMERAGPHHNGVPATTIPRAAARNALSVALADFATRNRLEPDECAYLFDAGHVDAGFMEAYSGYLQNRQLGRGFPAADPKDRPEPIPAVREDDPEQLAILRQHAPEALGLPRPMVLPAASERAAPEPAAPAGAELAPPPGSAAL